MKTTRYFEEQVLRKRPYIQRGWCERAIQNPAYVECQSDGKQRHWVFIEEIDKWIRVILLQDGETVLNAFPDRGFREPKP